MLFIIFIWGLVWGGMFSSPSVFVLPSLFSNPIVILMTLRPHLPVIAVYICFLWIFFTRKNLFPPLKTPLGLLSLYCLVGLASSFFLSSQSFTSVNWGLRYLSCLIVIWIALKSNEPLHNLRAIIYFNYALAIAIVAIILPEAFRLGIRTPPLYHVYQLPLNLGLLRVNGAGRLALVLIILSFIRMITSEKTGRYFWILILIPSLFVITQTQSRTSLLGLVVCSILFIYLKGIDLKYLFLVGPVSAYIFWQSAYKWRSEESLERLFYLTGRENTWQKGIELFKHSPIFGSGFHADRLMLDFEHMHHSYFHALVQSGALGTIFFLAAIISVWILVFRYRLLKRVREIQGIDQAFLIESILLLAFFTARSFFESTGAFYGVDLLLMVPAMMYIWLWIQENPVSRPEHADNEPMVPLQQISIGRKLY
jgi:O-antigen ligase